MTAAVCHCCGGVPEVQGSGGGLRFCGTCRTGCRLVMADRIIRGPACPFIRRRGSLLHYVPELPPDDPPRPPRAPERTPARSGVLSTGLPPGADFVWRGRARRNVPGG